MTESSKITKDPSLKRYFKFMLTNRKMSVQFTSRKIREIIETDLGIKLQPPQSLYARVCIEAFAYYMQSWPEWNLAIRTQYSDKLYECLITYLRNKLLYLKQKEQAFKQSTIDNNTVTLTRPVNMPIVPQRGMKKVKSPYCLKVNIPHYLWNSTKITMRNYGTQNIYLEFGKLATLDHDLGVKDLLNHPFVHVEFRLPGLIRFSRSSPFKIERYLQTMSDDPLQLDSNHIISIVESDKKSPHKVYTYQLMTALFNSLNKALGNCPGVSNDIKLQISVLCDAFLVDIFETNIKKTTVCEGSTVSYNIGKSTYFIDSELNTHNSLNEKLVFKKLITPIVSYNLISCSVTNENVEEDGKFDYFDFYNNCDQLYFVNRLKSCLKYKCLICDAFFSLDELKKHLTDIHPTHKKLKCVKCLKRLTVGKLLTKRWKHDCPLVPFKNLATSVPNNTT